MREIGIIAHAHRAVRCNEWEDVNHENFLLDRREAGDTLPIRYAMTEMG